MHLALTIELHTASEGASPISAVPLQVARNNNSVNTINKYIADFLPASILSHLVLICMLKHLIRLFANLLPFTIFSQHIALIEIFSLAVNAGQCELKYEISQFYSPIRFSALLEMVLNAYYYSYCENGNIGGVAYE